MLGSSAQAQAHALMGCDITGKVGTTHVIKADPMVYLGQFGKQINEAQWFDIMLLAEHYLVKVLKQVTSCTNMDDFHYCIAGNKTTEYGHIMRSIYMTYMST